jgi:predicted lipoprotein with Yx(FWY)xxD motif
MVDSLPHNGETTTGAGLIEGVNMRPTLSNPTRRRPLALFAAAALGIVAMLATAACTSSKANPAGAPQPTAPPSTTGGPAATVNVANSGLGQILVDPQGRTLYLFQADTGTTSACSGACATAWPPLRATGQPTVGGGANASLVGTTARSDGNPQVTYNGHPLYSFIQDKKPGDTTGQGLTAFGGGWFVLSPAGNQIAGSTSASGASGY